MRKKYKKVTPFMLLLAILCSAALVGCSQNKTNESSYGGKSSRSSAPLPYDDDYTLLIYMCGSSLESKNGSASDDITELLNAEVPDKVNIVLETGGAERWKKHGISSEKLQRYRVADNRLELLEESSLACMGDSETLKSFVDWGTKKFPAKKTALILWDHGGGFLKGICKDELYMGDWLTVQEFEAALSASEFTYAFDFIGLDACYMANYETALALSEFTDYMIAGEINEPTDGWDYKTLAQSLGGGDEKNSILKGFEKSNEGGEYSLSLIDLTQLDKVRSVLMQCKDKGAENFTSALSCVEAVSSSYYLYDLGEAARSLNVEYDFSGVISVVSSEPDNASGGISFCFPVDDEEQLAEYLHSGKDPDYNEFLKNLAAKEMTAAIKAQIKNGDKQGTEFYYNVAEYAYSLLRQSLGTSGNTQKMLTLVKAMLNYGAYSQEYFNFNTDYPANIDLPEADKSLTDYQAADYEIYNMSCTQTGTDGAVTYYGSSLILNSNTDIKHYFTFDTSKTSIDDIACTDSEDTVYAINQCGDNSFCIKIGDIAPDKLDKAVTLTVSSGGVEQYTVNYSPLSYFYHVLKNYPTDVGTHNALRNVVKALYKYRLAAYAYAA